MTTVIAEFDGKVFIPQGPVELAPGTKVAIPLPTPACVPTAEDRQSWEELMRKLNETEPYFPTVEDAIGYSRKYPGYYP
jgi:hypothetical protein